MNYFENLMAIKDKNIFPALMSLNPKDYMESEFAYAIVGITKYMSLPKQMGSQDVAVLITATPFFMLNCVKSKRLYLKQMGVDAKSLSLGFRSFEFLEDEWARGYASLYYNYPPIFIFAVSREQIALSRVDPGRFISSIITLDGKDKEAWSIYPHYDSSVKLHVFEVPKPINDSDFDIFYNMVMEAGERLVLQPDSEAKEEQLSDYMYLCRKMASRVLK